MYDNTDLSVDPLLYIHWSACHVINLVLDVSHGFISVSDDA